MTKFLCVCVFQEQLQQLWPECLTPQGAVWMMKSLKLFENCIWMCQARFLLFLCLSLSLCLSLPLLLLSLHLFISMFAAVHLAVHCCTLVACLLPTGRCQCTCDVCVCWSVLCVSLWWCVPRAPQHWLLGVESVFWSTAFRALTLSCHSQE